MNILKGMKHINYIFHYIYALFDMLTLIILILEKAISKINKPQYADPNIQISFP